MRALVLGALAVTGTALVLVLQHGVADAVLYPVFGSVSWVVAAVVAATATAVPVAALETARQKRWRLAAGLGVAAMAVCAGLWWLGVAHGVLVTMELEGAPATELPPLDLYLNPHLYAVFDGDEELALDLGALPGLLRTAGWLHAGSVWMPALLAGPLMRRALAWSRSTAARQHSHQGSSPS